ncbi:MAG TPA: SMI1/KNR4 family protein [Burkholderiaceae bacterium]
MSIFDYRSWKKLIAPAIPDQEHASPADATLIQAAEHNLGIMFPAQLRDLLLECDGVTARYGSKAVWTVSEIQRCNNEFRNTKTFHELYMPFDHLLFFGDDVNGDQFAFAIHPDGQIHKPDIYCWDHETDSRIWFASDMKQYLEKRLAQ